MIKYKCYYVKINQYHRIIANNTIKPINIYLEKLFSSIITSSVSLHYSLEYPLIYFYSAQVAHLFSPSTLIQLS